jgi:ATP-dependent Clp protease ATP-binding subunit ClpA
MPEFPATLSKRFHRSLALANERHHEYATLEHLLLALIDDQDAVAVMYACNVDLDKLRRSPTAIWKASSKTWRAAATRRGNRIPAGGPACRNPRGVVGPQVVREES